MAPPRTQPTEEDWLRAKPAIRRMYIVEGQSLKELIEKAAGLGLHVTKSQLEYKLKQWGFRRNVDKEAWISIDRKITKRKAEGKESQVLLCGKRLKTSTVERQTDHHRDTSVFAKFAPARSPSPTLDTQVIVCTPQPLSMEFRWPGSLPWLKFQDLHFQKIAELATVWRAGREKSKDSQFVTRTQRVSILSTTIAPAMELQSNDVSNQVPKLASIIGTSMPESYPGEHLQRAQCLLNGSEHEIQHESLAVLIYQVSNNLIDLTYGYTWKYTIRSLRECGMFDLRVDLSGFQDATIRAFMDNLFTATILQRTSYDEAMRVMKWLLSKGQSPNTYIRVRWEWEGQFLSTPLQRAASNCDVELVDMLLAAGADVNFAPPNDQLGSPVELAIKMGSEDIFERLLEHSTSTNMDRSLLLAVYSRSWNILEALAQRGGNLCATVETKTRLEFEQTPLSLAAEAGETEVEYVLGLLGVYAPSTPLVDAITADVFIAAATKGKDDSIRVLSDISSAGSCVNALGITPLGAAAGNGHISTCRLLLDLYDSANLDMGYLSPMFLAGYGGYFDVLRLFIEKGANVNAISAVGDQLHVQSQRIFPNSELALESYPTGDQTLLAILLKFICGARYDQYRSELCACAALLIETGARMSGEEVFVAVRAGSIRLLSAALAAGSSPNSKSRDGTSILQFATKQLRTHTLDAHTVSNLEAVRLLLKGGATLSGGEVIAAIRVCDWDLVQTFLQHGASLVEVHDSGMTALEAAILSSSRFMITRILGGLPGLYEAGALCAGVANQQDVLVNRILASRPAQAQLDILETTAIGIAAAIGNMRILRKLLECLPQSNFALLPSQAFMMDHGWSLGMNGMGKSVLQLFASSPFWRRGCVGGKLLTLAAMGSPADAFLELLQHGYEPDKATWAMLAARNSLELTEMLVNHNKRVGDDRSLIDWPKLFASPLISAIRCRNNELALLLLKAGADVNEHHVTRPLSRCPLQLAIELGDLGLVDILLEAGADVNSPPASNGGATALQLAAIKGYLGLANLLIERDAQVNTPRAPEDGRTALEGAAEHGRLDMLQLLLTHGAQTTGDGQHQYLRAVKRAAQHGYHTAADLLRECREWSDEDHRLFGDKDLLEDWYESSTFGEDGELPVAENLNEEEELGEDTCS